jgi:hypothetical protein
MSKGKLLVRIMKCSGHPESWYNHPDYMNTEVEVYLERDCFMWIEDTDEQQYVVAEDYHGYGPWRGLIQADCVILKILPA